MYDVSRTRYDCIHLLRGQPRDDNIHDHIREMWNHFEHISGQISSAERIDVLCCLDLFRRRSVSITEDDSTIAQPNSEEFEAGVRKYEL